MPLCQTLIESRAPACAVAPVLRVKNLTKTFTNRRIFGKSTTTRAVDDVTLELEEGKVLVIAGESGSGKSTIAKLILGALEPDSGSIYLDGSRITGDKKSRRRLQRSCQMVQQDPYDSVNPRMKVRNIVSEALEIHHLGDSRSRAARVDQALRDVKLDPRDAAGKYPHMLSGGQRQRVVLARALTVEPRIIIADEPVSMLDVSIRAEMLELMRDLQQKRGISFIYITHDLATARHFGTEIAILYRGAVVERGDIDAVLDGPKHPYTRALLGAISEPDPANRFRQRDVSDWEGAAGA